MSYRFVKSTDSPIVAHAEHNVEEWHGYVNDLSDAPEYVNGDSSGLCCHDCRTIIIDTTEEN